LTDSDFDCLLADLSRRSAALEQPAAWPAEQFTRLAGAEVLAWVIPRAFGGSETPFVELMAGYERLAQACLVTTFVLTQRNGACQRIAGSANDDLKSELLPALAAGDVFATVGISHLTTSRQHLRQPVVSVAATGGGLRFDGVVPWVTGAKFADYVVTGGACADGRQVLAVIPTANRGVAVQPPAPLLALNASQTGAVELNGVEIETRYILDGPVERVMQRGQGGGTGSITTSALAVGHAAAALAHLREEADRRPDLREIYEPLAAERAALSADIRAAAEPAGEQSHLGRDVAEAACFRDSPKPAASATKDQESLKPVGPPTAELIRARANSLVLRATQAYLAASKGAGFVTGHPAERAVREAMFFLVWSCPQPVLTAALREFACLSELV
jgi:alkylation response protein AidB-like acyl-CoA dehydrogenase